MNFGGADNILNILKEEECDLKRASYSPSLSVMEFDEKSKSFFASLDKIPFAKPNEVIIKILEANGYVVNLENILACIDDFVIGMRTKIRSRKSEEEPLVAKEYFPILHFRMPSKSRIGPILSRFYGEVQAYESEISKLQGEKDTKKDPKEQSPEDMRREIKNLRHHNYLLSEKINKLTQKINTMSHNAARGGSQESSELPETMRLGKVRSVHEKERHCVVSTGRSNFNVPLQLLGIIPLLGDECMLNVDNGSVINAMLAVKNRTPFKKILGRVLAKEGNKMKVRGTDRKSHIIKAITEDEKKTIAGMNRGDLCQLGLGVSNIVDFRPFPNSNEAFFSEKMQESIATFHAQIDYQENILEMVEVDLSSSEEDVA